MTAGPAIRMHGHWRSSAAFRVRVALNLKRLPYRETMVDIDAGEQHAPEYRAINPAGTVPTVFFDGGPTLTQSLAVVEYLDETHPEPALLPADPAGRARVRSLALLWAADHHPLITPRVRRQLGALGLDQERQSEWVRHWLRQALEVGEARLADDPATGRFCHGERIGLADLCLLPQANAARIFGATYEDLPTISRIVAACHALDEVQRAMPMRQEGAPRS